MGSQLGKGQFGEVEFRGPNACPCSLCQENVKKPAGFWQGCQEYLQVLREWETVEGLAVVYLLGKPGKESSPVSPSIALHTHPAGPFGRSSQLKSDLRRKLSEFV